MDVIQKHTIEFSIVIRHCSEWSISLSLSLSLWSHCPLVSTTCFTQANTTPLGSVRRQSVQRCKCLSCISLSTLSVFLVSLFYFCHRFYRRELNALEACRLSWSHPAHMAKKCNTPPDNSVDNIDVCPSFEVYSGQNKGTFIENRHFRQNFLGSIQKSNCLFRLLVGQYFQLFNQGIALERPRIRSHACTVALSICY